jgi:cytochrome c oxidase subunit 2
VPRSLRSRITRIGLAASAPLLLAGCSAHDLESKMRFGWPTGVTHQGDRARTLWTWSSVAALVVGVIVWGLIFWCCIRYRRRADSLPRQTKYHLPIEIAYSVAPFLIVAVLFWYTAVTENYVNKLSAHPQTTVQVDAFKWNWQFEYPTKTYSGVDPRTGVQDGKANQPVSTVGSSTEIPVLVIPRGQSVRFVEVSRDVIHSFWVPEFLFKRDVIPYGARADGTAIHPNQFELTAKSDGHFVGRCAELCGTYHSQMNFEVRVVEPAKYQQYLDSLAALGSSDPARQSKALQAIGEDPAATTTRPFNTDRNVRSATTSAPN